MAILSTKKKISAPAEKPLSEMSERTLSRKVKELEGKVEALQDLADLHIEETYAKFQESRPHRPMPQVIYAGTPCGCQDGGKEVSGWLEVAFWCSIGVIALALSKKGQNRGE